MHIVSIALDVPLYKTFSYVAETKLLIGQRVLVEFINKKIVGFVWDTDPLQTNIQNPKSIIEVFPECLSPETIALLKFTANYYHYPIGATIFNAIPKALKEAKPYIYKPKKIKSLKSDSTANKGLTLNQEQMHVVTEVIANQDSYYPCILYGITGSGKTEVYLEVIHKVIEKGYQVLVLVPEINLTPQMLARFSTRFNQSNMVVLTSNTAIKDRNDGYHKAQIGECQIVIGTRLSVFTPFKTLGLIVIDEEHDQSFKQNDNLRYHARDLAIWRANQYKIPIILGSATPSLETLYNYKLGRYKLFKLTSRAVSTANLPQIELIDLKLYQLKYGLTEKVVDLIAKNLEAKELSLIFINRRGYSPIISCYECGWVSRCKNCSTTMVYHSVSSSLKCHHCGFNVIAPKNCPKCNSQHLQALGEGTQKVEEYLQRTFPHARICRTDQDTINTKSAWDDLYTKIHNNEVDILVGTQMLAKGHDFHNLTLVACLNIDTALYSYDFRASELLFTQLTQVAGRAGRGEKLGKVYIQTRYPDHELYQYLIKHDFNGFINYQLKQRKELILPPYSYYAIFRCTGKKIKDVLDYLSAVAKLMQKISETKEVTIYPPVPSIIQRLKNKERGQILIQTSNRNLLHQLFTQLVPLLEQMKPRYAIKWSIDIDPYEI